MTKIPQNANFLERAIRSLVGTNEEAYRLRVMMANVIVGQFLRDGVARGGTSMKLRYGNSTTRFTMDFDVARRTELKDFIEEFAHRLEEGWGAFGLSVLPTVDEAIAWANDLIVRIANS